MFNLSSSDQTDVTPPHTPPGSKYWSLWYRSQDWHLDSVSVSTQFYHMGNFSDICPEALSFHCSVCMCVSIHLCVSVLFSCACYMLAPKYTTSKVGTFLADVISRIRLELGLDLGWVRWLVGRFSVRVSTWVLQCVDESPHKMCVCPLTLTSCVR